jgi:hypothetical protein
MVAFFRLGEIRAAFACLVVDESAPDIGSADDALRAVQPTAVGGIVKPTAELQTAVAGAVLVSLELQSQFEVGEFLFGQQPNVVVVFAPHGVAENGAVRDSPKGFALVSGLALDRPTGQVFAIEEGVHQTGGPA